MISGVCEDLLAAFLDSHLNAYDEILVDQPISFFDSKETTNYPDIALLRRSTLADIVDVKTDLGHQRKKKDALRFYNDESDFIKRIRGKEGSITKGNERRRIKVARNCLYHLVIISGRNITERELGQWLEIGTARKYAPYVSTYVLSGLSPNSFHPNELADATSNDLSLLDIRSNAFLDLLRKLKR
jgi:predicted Rdx family selenoprotein